MPWDDFDRARVSARIVYTFHRESDQPPNRSPRRSRKKVEGLTLLEDIIDEPLVTQRQLGQRYGVTGAYVGMLLKSEGITGADHRAYKRAYKAELRDAQTRLVTLLLQYNFNRLVEEKGKNYALAWRIREIYGVGKNLSLDSLERLIGARRSGEGFHRCVKLSGWASDTDEIKRRCPNAKFILDRALHDIEYDKPTEEFGARRYFSAEDEERELIRLYNTGAANREIAESLSVPGASVAYHLRRLGLPSRRTKPKSPRVNKDRVLQLLARGVRPRDIQKVTGYHSSSYYRWGRKLQDGTLNASPRSPTRSKYGDDALAYYLLHFSELTRTQLSRDAPGLYNRLRISGEIMHVPTLSEEEIRERRSNANSVLNKWLA